MPANYRKTALMSIASVAVKEDLKREERRILTEGLITDDDHICEKLFEYAINMSADNFVDLRDLAEQAKVGSQSNPANSGNGQALNLGGN